MATVWLILLVESMCVYNVDVLWLNIKQIEMVLVRRSPQRSAALH